MSAENDNEAPPATPEEGQTQEQNQEQDKQSDAAARLAAAEAALAAEREARRNAESTASQAVQQLALATASRMAPAQAQAPQKDEFAALREHLPDEVLVQFNKLLNEKVEATVAPLRAKMYEAEVRATTAAFEAELATKHNITVPKEVLEEAQRVSVALAKESGGRWNHEDTLNLAVGKALREGKLTIQEAAAASAAAASTPKAAPRKPAAQPTLVPQNVPASSGGRPQTNGATKTDRQEIEELEKRVGHLPLF